MGTTRPQLDIPRLIALYRSGATSWTRWSPGAITLDRINEAIASSAAGEALRNVIVFEQPGARAQAGLRLPLKDFAALRENYYILGEQP